MRRGSGLAWRLSLNLLVVFVAGSIVFWLAYMGVSLAGIAGDTDMQLFDFAEIPARENVEGSIVEAADGKFEIRPTEDLIRQLERTPSLKYAVFKEGEALRGSSPELVDILSAFDFKQIGLFYGGMVFSPSRALSIRPCYISAKITFLFALCGYEFEWRVFWDLLFRGAQEVFRWSPPVLLIAIISLWLTVRRGLAPVTGAVERVSKIDINTLAPHILTEDVPAEIRPLIAALNNAFARIKAGVARERRFIANAAHELRTPITALRARIDNPDDVSLRQDMDRYSQRLQSLAEQLLVSARLSERTETFSHSVDLAAVALELVADYLPFANSQGRQIEIEGPLSGVIVQGDRQAIESILSNLLDNAIRAEPANGTIVVRIIDSGKVDVIDHGKGVEEKNRSAVFEAFWRELEDATGTGLGLAITKELVLRLGGSVSVSETSGGGATFSVLLLRVSAERRPTRPRSEVK